MVGAEEEDRRGVGDEKPLVRRQCGSDALRQALVRVAHAAGDGEGAGHTPDDEEEDHAEDHAQRPPPRGPAEPETPATRWPLDDPAGAESVAADGPPRLAFAPLERD